MKNIKPFLAVLSFFSPVVYGQNVEQKGEGVSKMNLSSNIEWKAEMQGTFSKGKTPLWLNANKHGLSSLKNAMAIYVEVWFVLWNQIQLVVGQLAMAWILLYQ